MKIIHYLNTIIYFLSALSIFFVSYINDKLVGLLILIPILLGIYQPLFALIILSIIDRSDKSKMKHLSYYLGGVFIYFIFVFFLSAFHLDYKFIGIIMSAIPIMLATYFVFVTYKIQKS